MCEAPDMNVWCICLIRTGQAGRCIDSHISLPPAMKAYTSYTSLTPLYMCSSWCAAASTQAVWSCCGVMLGEDGDRVGYMRD